MVKCKVMLDDSVLLILYRVCMGSCKMCVEWIFLIFVIVNKVLFVCILLVFCFYCDMFVFLFYFILNSLDKLK